MPGGSGGGGGKCPVHAGHNPITVNKCWPGGARRRHFRAGLEPSGDSAILFIADNRMHGACAVGMGDTDDTDGKYRG